MQIVCTVLLLKERYVCVLDLAIFVRIGDNLSAQFGEAYSCLYAVERKYPQRVQTRPTSASNIHDQPVCIIP